MIVLLGSTLFDSNHTSCGLLFAEEVTRTGMELIVEMVGRIMGMTIEGNK